MPRLLLARLATAVLVAGCSNATEPDHTGSMSFDYHGSLAGAPSGHFDVVGSRNPFPDDHPTGAGGFTNTDGSLTIVEITGSRHEGPQEFSILFGGAPALGAVPMCGDAPVPATMCVSSGYWVTGPGSNLHNFGASYPYGASRPEMRVTITSLTNRRISGTFEGIAVGSCDTCTPSGVVDTVTFTSGRFDVPYR